MQTRRHARGTLAAILAVTATLAIAVSSTAAHTQTVNPKGGDAGFTNEPISKAWAQAHCNAHAPAVVSGASDGVVAFNPPTALPCPASVTNPGGQVTGP